MAIQSIFLATLIQDLHLNYDIYINTTEDGYDNSIFSDISPKPNEEELEGDLVGTYNNIYFVAMNKKRLKDNINMEKEKNTNRLKKW